MTRVALFACLALAACSRPVSCVVSTAADNPLPEAVGHILNSKDVVIRVAKVENDGMSYKLIGVMENVSGHRLADAVIQCKFSDKDGHTITSDDDYGFNMAPGEVKNLSISIIGHDQPAGWSCSVTRVTPEI